MANPFERIQLVRPRRSVHDLTESHDTTMNIGEAIISYKREMVPGDSFELAQVASAEFMPTIAPFKGDLYMESVAFFVPYDLCEMEEDGGSFSDLLLSVVDTQESIPIPKWKLKNLAKDTARGTLWDYCGFPVDMKNAPDDKIMPLAYLQRGYNLINNEYLRDEFVDPEVPLDSNDIQTVCYKKDYFTSCSKEPQKGEAPYLELKGTAAVSWSEEAIGQLVGILSNYRDIKYSTGSSTTKQISAGSDISATGSSGGLLTPKGTESNSSGAAQASNLGLKVDKTLLDFLNDNTLDTSKIITFNINDLRLLNRLQKWLERNAICGTRYKEYLLANYGIAPRDETLQRPAFIGRVRTPVIVNSVLQTSESQNTFQGTKTGNATASNPGYFGKWLAKEFGIVYVISWLRPRAQYSQGMPRQWIKDSVYDFFNPIFEGLGMQEVLKGEIFCDGTDEDLEPLGYQDRYNDMRTAQNLVTGMLRPSDDGDSLEVWAVQRKFSEHPTLSSEFLHVKKSDFDYLFAVDSDDPHAPQCVAHFKTFVKAVRPIHKFNMATL